ncbi:MAG: hypothetical protein AB8G77_03710, partial [Rhodothermales bacterium]
AQEAETHEEDDHSGSRFSDEPIPLAEMPERPKPIIELGEPFLGTGTLKQGIKLPTGAVWQPAFLAYGTVRSALQSINQEIDDTNLQLSEAAFRFDLFGNLYLTASERLLIGFRPLDEGGQFTRYTLNTNLDLDEDDFVDELNFGIRTLFFEGDLGELFPALDWADSKGLDIGISIGRQPLSFQDGMLINEDAMDLIGLTKANIKMGSLVNVRATALLGWGDIDRPVGLANVVDGNILGTNIGDKSAGLIGLFTEMDSRKRTIEADIVYVFADDIEGSGIYAGVGSTRRFGRFNNTIRVVASMPAGDEGVHNSEGVLISNQFSWTPHHSHNHVYISTFIGINEFRSAARGPASGGPLGRTGILFSAVGIGRFGAPLGNLADYAVGGSAGYQFFFADTRQQLIVEVGGRTNYEDKGLFLTDTVAGGARYQIALSRRGIILIDGFTIYDMDLESVTVAGRLEFVLKL